MELFTVSVSTPTEQSASLFVQSIRQKFNGLHIAKHGFRFRYIKENPVTSWTCKGDETKPGFSEWMPRIFKMTAEILAEYIVIVKEPELIMKLIRKHASAAFEDDYEQIQKFCSDLLGGGVPLEGFQLQKGRMSKVEDVISTYLKENVSLNLDGFIKFRLQNYEAELHEMVQYAIDEFLLDKQYEEFIGLLKYFVYFQESRMPLVHVMHKQNQEFVLLNEQMNPIEVTSEGVVVEMLDQEMELEDMIVSSLISISPAKIIIHTCEPDIQIISTIRQIFESRAHICLHCQDCSPHLGNGLLHAQHEIVHLTNMNWENYNNT
ncbi:putative sporulation protein YtxC [Paenibacillus sediminis]|uniref:Sporulation protein YtxC n=1 Tax=Paenibacillus sediminis TaxID=664909 RepID=A0ABS4H7Y6_9BACL|nr:putative sporulation protein YtxC [Paenibacillus sediminis]MBP1938634.1 putative sporulation protein YtxC [Paenibacillus sediminis]